MTAIEIIHANELLKRGFIHIIDHNESNFAPYHNLQHLLGMVQYCTDGEIAENLSDKEILELGLAALFHDTDHTMGYSKDDVNIKNSKKFLLKFLKTLSDNEETKSLIKLIDINNIMDMLDATEFPYKINSENLNEQQQIIRDADLMSMFEPTWICFNILGLAEELNISFRHQLVQQKKFIDNAKYITDWGNKIKKEKWDEMQKQFNFLLNSVE